MSEITGIDAAAVTTWLRRRTEVTPPLDFELIAGGHSNLTYAVTDGEGRRWALRRPPMGHVLESAHDMGREHRIIAALAASDVPVPTTVGLCEDIEVNGAPFYVMDYVDGTVVRDRSIAEGYDHDEQRRMARSLVHTLGVLHRVDPDEVGLGDLGRKEGYIARQLRRWHGQWEQSKTRELPQIEVAHRMLSEQIPEQGPAGIVHGDYRLDNCIVGEDHTISAVLDWELCTLGDVLADMGALTMYWARPGDPHAALADAPTLAEGFPGRDEIAEWYGEASGKDLRELPYYVAFATWRAACIIEGVYARYLHGAMGDKDPGSLQVFADQVERLATTAHDLLVNR